MNHLMRSISRYGLAPFKAHELTDFQAHVWPIFSVHVASLRGFTVWDLADRIIRVAAPDYPYWPLSSGLT